MSDAQVALARYPEIASALNWPSREKLFEAQENRDEVYLQVFKPTLVAIAKEKDRWAAKVTASISDASCRASSPTA